MNTQERMQPDQLSGAVKNLRDLKAQGAAMFGCKIAVSGLASIADLAKVMDSMVSRDPAAAAKIK